MRMKNSIINVICVATLTLMLSSCAKMYLSKGKEDLSNLNYVEAIESLERSVEKKPSVEASTLLALAYAKKNQNVAAVYEFDKVKNDPSFNDSLKLIYASSLLGAKKYNEAKTIAEGILSRKPGDQAAQSIKLSAGRVNKMMQDSALYQVDKMKLNGVSSAMSPVKMGEKLVITGGESTLKVQDNFTGISFLDLYEVSDSTGVKKLPFSDTKFHDGMASFNKEGNMVIFTRTNQPESNELAFDNSKTSHPQLYSSKKESNGWTKPEKLSFNDAKYIFAHPALSEDGKILYFSSNKSGGAGGMDLYKSSYYEGAWGAPVSLGSDINTVRDDAFPVLKDDNTLYFSSNGHQTLGGLDILYTTSEGSGWNAPVHLSYPLNTSKDDFGILFTDENKGLLSSDRGTDGLDKVYRFEQFFPELVLAGSVTESETGEVIPNMQIRVKNLTDNSEEILETDVNGNFKYDLLPNKEYEIIAEDLSDDQIYFNSSKKISTMNLREDETFDLDFNLEAIKTPEDPDNIKPGEDGTYPIPNIYWDYNKWEVRTDAEPYLDMVTNLLKTNPGLKVEIRSHCDSRGSLGFNRSLSKKRAKAVLNYLVNQGIARNRLTSKGLGEKELLNKCADGVECTEEEHQQNRRSEFIVTDKSGNKKKID